MAQGAAFQPPPEAVTTIVAHQEEWSASVSSIGTVAAVQGVTVSADLPGTVERFAFESGTAVREGEVLALLDTRQEQAQLTAAEAQRDLARLNFERMQGLLNERVISQSGVRPRHRRATARRRARRRNPRGDRQEDDPGAVLRACSGSGGSTWVSTCPAATRW
jgi:membrane fusion protein (multidrug efflux system)